ncbi:unnamed protein product [Haemonchus placei]|uniref:DDHD domain-containing protein n=1 Tax=Haemonchus placei TaxID=6290 RepID=A0A0N4WNX4_HAEPC|nr:unnamed protein product [Haemonchus placei]
MRAMGSELPMKMGAIKENMNAWLKLQKSLENNGSERGFFVIHSGMGVMIGKKVKRLASGLIPPKYPIGSLVKSVKEPQVIFARDTAPDWDGTANTVAVKTINNNNELGDTDERMHTPQYANVVRHCSVRGSRDSHARQTPGTDVDVGGGGGDGDEDDINN